MSQNICLPCRHTWHDPCLVLTPATVWFSHYHTSRVLARIRHWSTTAANQRQLCSYVLLLGMTSCGTNRKKWRQRGQTDTRLMFHSWFWACGQCNTSCTVKHTQQRVETMQWDADVPTKISQFLLDCVTSYAQRISEYEMPPMMKNIIRGPLLALVWPRSLCHWP